MNTIRGRVSVKELTDMPSEATKMVVEEYSNVLVRKVNDELHIYMESVVFYFSLNTSILVSKEIENVIQTISAIKLSTQWRSTKSSVKLNNDSEESKEYLLKILKTDLPASLKMYSIISGNKFLHLGVDRLFELATREKSKNLEFYFSFSDVLFSNYLLPGFAKGSNSNVSEYHIKKVLASPELDLVADFLLTRSNPKFISNRESKLDMTFENFKKTWVKTQDYPGIFSNMEVLVTAVRLLDSPWRKFALDLNIEELEILSNILHDRSPYDYAPMDLVINRIRKIARAGGPTNYFSSYSAEDIIRWFCTATEVHHILRGHGHNDALQQGLKSELEDNVLACIILAEIAVEFGINRLLEFTSGFGDLWTKSAYARTTRDDNSIILIILEALENPEVPFKWIIEMSPHRNNLHSVQELMPQTAY